MAVDHDDILKRLIIEGELAIDVELAAPGCSYSSIVDWASSELASPEPHPLAYELFEKGINQYEILKQIADDRFGFLPFSRDGDQIVGQIAREVLRRYLDGALTPMQLCLFIAQIDAYYIDCVPDDHPTPTWVHELYNACDWCDESWPHSTLVDVVERVDTDLGNL